MITIEVIRKLAMTLPGTEEGISYGTPAFRVGKRLFLRLHSKEDAIVLLLNTIEEQQQFISQDPMSFFITDHYTGYPAILVRPTIEETSFRNVMELAWRRVARKADIVEHELHQ